MERQNCHSLTRKSISGVILETLRVLISLLIKYQKLKLLNRLECRREVNG